MRPLLIFFVVGLYLSYSSGQDEGPFGSFWHNQAHFEFIANCSFPTPSEAGTGTGNVGTYMVIVGETWYLFHREVHYALTPPSCKTWTSTNKCQLVILVVRYTRYSVFSYRCSSINKQRTLMDWTWNCITYMLYLFRSSRFIFCLWKTLSYHLGCWADSW